METSRKRAEDFESRYVYNPYEFLATTIATTSERRWQIVDEFIKSFPKGSILADLGCGDGRYLDDTHGVHIIGIDRSQGFLEVAKSSHRQCEVLQSNVINLPLRDNCVNGVICVSVLHHLSTKSRRLNAIKEINRILRRDGRVMIVSWAYENNYRQFEGQDVLIPLDLQSRSPSKTRHLELCHCDLCRCYKTAKDFTELRTKELYLAWSNLKTDDFIPTTYTKFQNLYNVLKSELLLLRKKLSTNLTKCSGNEAMTTFEKSSKPIISKRKETLGLRKTQSLPDLAKYNNEDCCLSSKGLCHAQDGVMCTNSLRYYHVFRKDELVTMVAKSKCGLKRVHSSFDKGHWIDIFEKL